MPKEVPSHQFEKEKLSVIEWLAKALRVFFVCFI